jgi:hypothetical protein
MAKPLQAKTERWEDPIVSEVRRSREDLFAAADYDIGEFCKRLRAQQQREGREALTRAPRKRKRQGHSRA